MTSVHWGLIQLDCITLTDKRFLHRVDSRAGQRILAWISEFAFAIELGKVMNL